MLYHIMKGARGMIIALDHGNKQVKLPSKRVFTSGLIESNSRPPFGKDTLKYLGKYYTLSDKRIPYQRDKTGDRRFYILTLFAAGFAIEETDSYREDLMSIQLLVGLPPAHFGSQYKKFENFFTRNEVEEFEFHNKKFKIRITNTIAYPQAYAAAMTMYNQIATHPKVVVIDIGGLTVDYLMIKNGHADLSVCDSLENGIILLYNQIIARVNSDFDLLLDESDIDLILKGEHHNFSDDIRDVVNSTAQMFISDLIAKHRERAIDLRSCKTVFVGGGSILLKNQIEASDKIAFPTFVDDISANAKGYEILYRASTAAENNSDLDSDE